MAINSDRPVGQPTAVAAQPPAPTPAATLAEPKPVRMTDSDKLLVTVEKGDTLFAMARLFADDKNSDGAITGKELTGFVGGIKKANGGNPAMAVNQTLKIPTKNGSDLTKEAAAVQKWLDANPNVGAGKVSDFMWRDIERTGAPSGWDGVAVPDQHGIVHTFLVSDGETDGNPKLGGVTMVQTLEQFLKNFETLAR